MEQRVFDPNDWDSMIHLMDELGSKETMFMGENSNHDIIYLSIFPDKIIVDTLYKYRGSEKNIYHRDGTIERIPFA